MSVVMTWIRLYDGSAHGNIARSSMVDTKKYFNMLREELSPDILKKNLGMNKMIILAYVASRRDGFEQEHGFAIYVNGLKSFETNCQRI